MTTYYLFLDTETGGLDAKACSLLSLCCVLTDSEGNRISGIDIYLRPDNGVYQVQPNALKVNSIDLTDQRGVVDYSEGKRLLERFIGALIETLPRQDTVFIIPVGWNLPFDLEFIYQHLISKQEFQTLINSYKMIDLASVWLYLKAIGKVSSKRDRLTDAAQFFGLEVEGAHDALFDTLLTRDVFLKIKDVL